VILSTIVYAAILEVCVIEDELINVAGIWKSLCQDHSQTFHTQQFCLRRYTVATGYTSNMAVVTILVRMTSWAPNTDLCCHSSLLINWWSALYVSWYIRHSVKRTRLGRDNGEARWI